MIKKLQQNKFVNCICDNYYKWKIQLCRKDKILQIQVSQFQFGIYAQILIKLYNPLKNIPEILFAKSISTMKSNHKNQNPFLSQGQKSQKQKRKLSSTGCSPNNSKQLTPQQSISSFNLQLNSQNNEDIQLMEEFLNMNAQNQHTIVQEVVDQDQDHNLIQYERVQHPQVKPDLSKLQTNNQQDLSDDQFLKVRVKYQNGVEVYQLQGYDTNIPQEFKNVPMTKSVIKEVPSKRQLKQQHQVQQKKQRQLESEQQPRYNQIKEMKQQNNQIKQIKYQKSPERKQISFRFQNSSSNQRHISSQDSLLISPPSQNITLYGMRQNKNCQQNNKQIQKNQQIVSQYYSVQQKIQSKSQFPNFQKQNKIEQKCSNQRKQQISHKSAFRYKSILEPQISQNQNLQQVQDRRAAGNDNLSTDEQIMHQIQRQHPNENENRVILINQGEVFSFKGSSDENNNSNLSNQQNHELPYFSQSLQDNIKMQKNQQTIGNSSYTANPQISSVKHQNNLFLKRLTCQSTTVEEEIKKEEVRIQESYQIKKDKQYEIQKDQQQEDFIKYEDIIDYQTYQVQQKKQIPPKKIQTPPKYPPKPNKSPSKDKCSPSKKRQSPLKITPIFMEESYFMNQSQQSENLLIDYDDYNHYKQKNYNKQSQKIIKKQQKLLSPKRYNQREYQQNQFIIKRLPEDIYYENQVSEQQKQNLQINKSHDFRIKRNKQSIMKGKPQSTTNRTLKKEKLPNRKRQITNLEKQKINQSQTESNQNVIESRSCMRSSSLSILARSTNKGHTRSQYMNNYLTKNRRKNQRKYHIFHKNQLERMNNRLKKQQRHSQNMNNSQYFTHEIQLQVMMHKINQIASKLSNLKLNRANQQITQELKTIIKKVKYSISFARLQKRKMIKNLKKSKSCIKRYKQYYDHIQRTLSHHYEHLLTRQQIKSDSFNQKVFNLIRQQHRSNEQELQQTFQPEQIPSQIYSQPQINYSQIAYQQRLFLKQKVQKIEKEQKQRLRNQFFSQEEVILLIKNYSKIIENMKNTEQQIIYQRMSLQSFLKQQGTRPLFDRMIQSDQIKTQLFKSSQVLDSINKKIFHLNKKNRQIQAESVSRSQKAVLQHNSLNQNPNDYCEVFIKQIPGNQQLYKMLINSMNRSKSLQNIKQYRLLLFISYFLICLQKYPHTFQRRFAMLSQADHNIKTYFRNKGFRLDDQFQNQINQMFEVSKLYNKTLYYL